MLRSTFVRIVRINLQQNALIHHLISTKLGFSLPRRLTSKSFPMNTYDLLQASFAWNNSSLYRK